MMETIFDIGLVMLLAAVGAWTVVARGTRTAVIVFITYGLLLSLAWVRIAAVDVALTEAAIGSGVTGMLLINAAARTLSDRAPGNRTRSRPSHRGGNRLDHRGRWPRDSAALCHGGTGIACNIRQRRT